MPSLDARGVASLLREYAQRTALRGGNPYRAKAYSRAADSLAALAVPLDVLIAEDRLTEIPGVGDAIADIARWRREIRSSQAPDRAASRAIAARWPVVPSRVTERASGHLALRHGDAPSGGRPHVTLPGPVHLIADPFT